MIKRLPCAWDDTTWETSNKAKRNIFFFFRAKQTKLVSIDFGSQVSKGRIGTGLVKRKVEVNL